MDLAASACLCSAALCNAFFAYRVSTELGRRHSRPVGRLLVLAICTAMAAQLCAAATLLGFEFASNSISFALASTACLILSFVVSLRFKELRLVSKSVLTTPMATLSFIALMFLSWASSIIDNILSSGAETFSIAALIWPLHTIAFYVLVSGTSAFIARQIEQGHMKVYSLKQDFTIARKSLSRAAVGLMSSSLWLLVIPLEKYLLTTGNASAAPLISGVLGFSSLSLIFGSALHFIDTLTDALALALVSPSAKESLLNASSVPA
ncbi:hypothetical protein HDU81_000045 [Chytriomyces hyalinus]|nr:hypothetical protein HDU81_000045 [Chytriomyces hyalinus]